MAELMKVQFYGDTLEVSGTSVADAQVSIRRVCEALGISMQGQIEKLRGKAWATIKENLMVAEDGKPRQHAMIPLKTLPMWLATIDARKVGEHVREKLIRYQQEAHDALAAHFLPAEPQPNPNAFAEVVAPLVAAIARLEERVGELQTGTAAALRLTQSQRAMMGAQMVGVTQTEAAEMLGVSERSIRNANRVRRELPALVPVVTRGDIDVATAAKVAGIATRAERVLRAENPKAEAVKLLACSC